MDKRSLFVVLFLSSLVVLSGCTFSNYYEFEEGVFCLEKYDITSGTLIYRYSSWNPFKDDSFVNDLKEAGYDVYKDKIGTDVMETYDASNLMKECFAGKYSVKDFLPPEYICSSNKDVIKDPNYSDLRV